MGFLVNKRGMIITDPASPGQDGFQKAAIARKKKAQKDMSAAEAAEDVRRAAATDEDTVIESNTDQTVDKVTKLKKARFAAAGANAPSERNRIKTAATTDDAASSGVQVNKFLPKKAIKKSQRMNQAGPSASKVRPWK